MAPPLSLVKSHELLLLLTLLSWGFYEALATLKVALPLLLAKTHELLPTLWSWRFYEAF